MTLRFTDLSTSRRAFVRRCQSLNYGSLLDVVVRNGEPAISECIAVVEERLDSREELRPEISLPDFTLAKEVCRLMERLSEIGNGVIKRVEVRGGIPRKITFSTKNTESTR